jgi:uncharacterized membrane protein HdeD (DUF308 family)
MSNIFGSTSSPAPPTSGVPATGGWRPGWIIAFGVVLVILGIVAFGSVVAATIASVYFVGVMMIVAGIAEIAVGIRARDWGPFLLWIVLGIFYALAGMLTIANPFLAAGVLTLFLGAMLIAAGIMRIIVAFQMKEGPAWLWVAVSGAISVLLGATILAQWPLSSLYALGVFLSVDLLFAGIGWITLGMTLSRLARRG